MMAKSGETAKTKRRRRHERGTQQVRLAGQRRRDRRGLLATTALQAGAVMMLYFPLGLGAQAQPAPTARPQGGAVVAGQATIGQTTAQTTVAQSSQRAAIDWTTYNIGAAHTVVYQQPNASSLTVNRVTASDPSQIAGKIQANGQIVIVNRSGVVFMNGSQVDAQSLVVSSADISNRNVMAGRMVFDKPGKPGAAISNAGTITVKETGLAALVAPNVANSGTITARMGHVVLAGAEAHTVDLYGDGLMSVDVTRQVQRGSNGSRALVTNSGTIAADGGTIVLTAQAADGIVTNLVTNTGRLRANTLSDKAGVDHTGTIVVSAVGGSISVEGPVQAQGRAPGTVGGTVVLAATDTVAVGAGARISASGQARGGTVAIGTNAARARMQGGGVPLTSARVATVAVGARISADAKVSGNGGSVAILSTENTSMAGAISARGGRRGGNGGNVEVSGGKGFALTGTVDAGAAKGLAGTILLDPTDLTITNGAAGGNVPAGGQVNFGDATPTTITDGTLNAFTGANVILQATNNITVSGTAAVSLQAGLALTLQAGNNLTVSAGTSLAAPQGVTLSAGSAAAPAPVAGGSLVVSGAVSSLNGIVRLTADGATGTVGIGANVSGANVQLVTVGGAISQTAGTITATAPTTGTVTLTSGAGISQSLTGTIVAPNLTYSAAGAVILPNGNNVVTVGVGSSTALTFNNTSALTVSGAVTASTGDVNITSAAGLTVSANVVSTAGNVTLNGSSLTQTAGVIQATAAVAVVDLQSTGAISQTGGTVSATTLRGTLTAASVSLPQANTVGTLGAFTTGGAFAFSNTGALTVTGAVAGSSGTTSISSTGVLTLSGTVSGPSVSLSGTGITQTAGTVTATTASTGTITLVTTGAVSQTGGTFSGPVLALTGTAASVSMPGANTVGALGAFTTTGSFAFNNGQALGVGGPIVAGTSGAGDATITSAGVLTVSGSITGQNLTLSGSGIGQGAGTITASNSATGTITLNGGGAYAQTGGTLSAAVLSGNLASLSAPGANTVSAVSALTATGGLVLNTTGALAINNTVSAGTADAVFVSGAGLTVNGTLSSTGGAVALTGTSVNLVAGSIVTANTRFDTSVGAAAAGVNGAGNIALAGTLTAPTVRLGVAEGVALVDGPKSSSLVVNGSFSVGANTLDLESTGAITQTGGTITAGTLTGSGSSLGFGNTSVTTLAGFTTSAGAFSLTDFQALTVTGPVAATGGDAVISTTGSLTISGGVSGGNVSLSGSSITQTAGVVTATTALSGTVALNTAGVILQTGGTVNGAVLTGPTTATSLSMPNANAVGALGAFTSTGAFKFNNTGALGVGGPIVAGTSGTGDASIISTGALTVLGSITAQNVLLSGSGIGQTAGTVTASKAVTGTITLNGGGAFSQTGGTLSSAVLSGTLASLSAPGLNTVAAVSGLTATGAVALNDTVALALSNTVAAGTGGVGDLVFVTSGALAVNGALSSPGVVALTGSSVTETAGSSINAATRFDVSVGAAAANFTLGGTITTPSTRLGQAKGVFGADGPRSTSLVVTGPFSVGTGALDLESTGAITQAGGAIAAGTLSGSSGSLVLSNTNITTLAGFTTTAGTLSLTDSHALTVTGAVAATGGDAVLGTTGALTVSAGISGGNVSLSGTSISQTAGAVTATTAATGTVTLTTAGAISQAGGTIGGAILTAPTMAASVLLVQGNTVGTVNTLRATGTLSFVNSGALTVAGPVTAGSGILGIAAGALTLTGTVSGPSVTLSGTSITQTAGTVTAATVGTGTVTLTTTGAVTQSGSGLVSGAVLTGTASSVAMPNANTVGTLAGFSTTGAFSFNDNQALTVTGSMTAGISGTGDAAITSAAGLTISGGVSGQNVGLTGTSITQTAGTVAALAAGSGTITVSSPGAVTQTGGIFSGAFLVSGGSPPNLGSLSLPGANTIGSLGNIQVIGALSFHNAGPLTTAGPVGAGILDGLSNASISSTGALTLNGSVFAGNVSLSGTSITQTAGQVTATEPSGSGIATITLTTAGAFVQSGTGTLAAAALTGSVGSLLAPNGNFVQVVSNLSGTGRVALNDTTALALNNTVAAGTGGAGNLAFVTSGALTVNGALTSPGVVALTGSSVTETAGSTINAGTRFDVSVGAQAANFTLGGTITTPSTRLGRAEGVLGADGPLSTSLVVTGPFTVGTNTLDLESSGAITQTGGTITAGTLTGNGGSLVLGNTSITTLAGFTTNAGIFSLTDSHALTVTGPVAATGGDAVIGTAAALTVSGAVSGGNVSLTGSSITQTVGAVTAMTGVTGTVTLTATGAGSTMQTGGTINGANLAGSAGSVSLLSANSVATLGLFTSTGAFAFQSAGALRVAGPVSAGSGTLGITAGGGLTLSGVVSGPSVTLAGTSITQTAGAVTATTAGTGLVTLSTAGALSQTGGTFNGAILTAPTMTASASLPDANAVGTLNTLTSAGAVSFVASGALIVAGPVTAGAGTAGIAAGAGLTLTGTVSGPNVSLSGTSIAQTAGLVTTGGTLTLSSAGAVTQAGGTVAAGVLTGTVGSLSLPTAANAVTALGPLSSTLAVPVGLLLNDTGPLAVNGTVQSVGNVVVAPTGALTVNGALGSSAGGVYLTTGDPGGITINGTLNAPTVGGAGVVSLSANNLVVAITANVTAGTRLDLAGIGGTALVINGGAGSNIGFGPAAVSTPTVRVGQAASTADGVTIADGVKAANITFAGDFNVGMATLDLETSGTVTVLNNAVITAGGLSGSTNGSTTVHFTTTPVVLGPFVTTGDLIVTAPGTLTVTSYAVAGNGNRLSLTSNALITSAGSMIGTGTVTAGVFTPGISAASRIELNADTMTIAPTTTVRALGGTIAVAPRTPRDLVIEAAQVGTELALTPTAVALLVTQTAALPGTLVLGTTSAMPTIGGAIATNITILAGVNLSATAANLGLYTPGNIAGMAGLVVGNAPLGFAGTLTGGAGGVVTLNASAGGVPLNSFDVLNNFSAGAGLSVSEIATATAGRSGLTALGTVSSVAGGVSLLSVGSVQGGARVGGTIAIGQGATTLLDATGQTLTLTARDGAAGSAAITQGAATTINAGTLTGGASTVDVSASGYDVLLNTAGASNTIGTLGTFIVGTGTGNAVTAQGAFRLVDLSALAITGQVTATSISIAASSVAVTGLLGARLVGAAGGDISLAATAGSLVVAGGTVAGQSGVGLSAPGGVAVTAGLVDAGAGAVGGTITSTSGLAVSGGSVFAGTVNVTGGVTMTGGLLHANTLNVGTVTYSDGDLYGGNAVALSVPAAALLATDKAGSGTLLTLTTAGSYTSNGFLYSGGAIGLVVAGDFSQPTGAFAATGNVTVAATGAVNQAAAGTIDAGGTVLLRGFGAPAAGTAASVLGTISGQTVQVIEPGYALTVAPASLPGSFPITVGALVNTYHCPGCEALTASSTYPATFSTAPATRPVSLRLDGGTLAMGALSADAVELHSLGATVQTGALVTSSLTGTAGYAGSVATLPVYSPGAAQARLAPGDAGYVAPGYVVAAAPVGATVTLTVAGNNIQSINGYQVAGDATTRGGLTLVDQPGNQVSSGGTTVASTGLVLTGVVRAGPSTDPLDATAEAAGGGGITMQTIGATGGLAVNGTLAGNAVSLVASGAIAEAVGSGVVVASALTGSGGGGSNAISLGSANQIATLNALSAPTGNITLVNSRDLVVGGAVSAANGSIAITAQAGTGTASTKEGAATGILTIVAPPVGSAATVTALGNVTLQGTSLAVNNGLIGAATNSGVGLGNLGLTATTGTLSITGGTVGAQTNVSISAPGGIAVSGGLVNGPLIQVGGSLLTLSGGSIVGNSVTVISGVRQTGGVLHGTSLTAGTVDFLNGDLYSGGNLLVAAEPSITGRIVAGGTLGVSGGNILSGADIYSGGNQTISVSGTFQQTSGTIAAGTGGSGASLAVGASNLVIQAAAGTLEASGAVTLTGGGGNSASILGRLAGASISLNEPNAALTFAPALFAGGTDHPLGGSASVVIGPVSTNFVCPGCATTGVGGPFTVNAAATQLATRPGTLALGGGTVVLGNAGYTSVIAANTVTLTSGGATTQVGGSLEASVLSGSAGYSGVVPGAQTRVGGGYAAAASVSGATVTLGSAANNITQVAGYQVRGDDASRAGLTLVDAPTAAGGLVVTGVVRAGPSSDPLDGSAAAATGNNLSITVSGANGALTIGSAGTTGTVLGGRVATLTTTGGGIAESGDGRIVAGTLTGSSSGGIMLAAASSGVADGGNQVATLGSLAANGGALTFQDSRNLAVGGAVTASGSLLLTAQSGRGTASVAEGQSAGNLAVTGSAVGSVNTALTAFGTLTGGTVTAPGTVTLLAGGDVNVGGVGATTLTGTAGGSFTAGGTFANATSTSAVAGTLTLTDSAAVTLGGVSRSQGAALVTAPSIISTGQLATPATIQLHGTGGGFTQTAGTVAAGTSLIVSGATDSAALTGGIVQQAGLLASGGTVRLLSSGDATQAAAGTVAAPVVQVVSLNGANTFGASNSATVSVPAASVTLSGVLPVFNVPNPAVTVATVSQPVAVRLDGATVTLSRQVQGDTVELHAAGNLTEVAGGVIQANVLTGTAGYAGSGLDASGLPTYATLNGTLPGQGTATLAATGNNILRLGDFQARTGLILIDAPANQALTTRAVTATGLTIGGTVRAGVATDALTAAAAAASGTAVAITLTGTASNLVIGDAVAPNAVLAGGIVTISTPGAVTEAAGGLLVASTLTGAASSVALAATGGNQVGQLGQFTTVGNFTLVNTPNLVVTGAVTAGPAMPVGTTPVLTLVGGGSIDINGGSLTAGTVSISSGGAFSETNGFIVANALTIASSNATAGSSNNQVTTIGAVTSPGGFSFTDTGSLLLAGPLSATNGAVSLNVGGSITAQGNVSASGAVTLAAGGTTTQNATSTITGASLSSTSGGAASFAGTDTFSGPITIAASGLTVTGTMVGTIVSLNAGTGALTEAAGATIAGASLTSLSAGATSLGGTVSTSGPITVTATGITVTGGISSSGAAVNLNAGSGSYVLGVGGTLQGNTISTTSGGVSTLSGTEKAAGALFAIANGITLNSAVTASAVTLQAGSGVLTQTAASVVTGTSVTGTSNGATSLAGLVTASGPISFTANGIGISGSVGSAGDAVTLNAGTGSLTQGGTVGAGTTFSGMSGQGTTVTGGTTAGGAVSFSVGTDLSLAAGSTTTAGAGLSAVAGGTATLAGTERAGGDVTVTASGIALTNSLSSVGGQVVLKATSGPLTEAGTLSAGAAVTESATGSATITGTQTAGGLVSISANGIAFSGNVTSQTDAVTFNAGTGALTQGGTVGAGTSFTGISGQGTSVTGGTTAGGTVSFSVGKDLSLAAGSTTTAGAGLSAVVGGNATLAGTERAGGDVTVTASGIALTNSLSSVGGQVALNATNGPLTQSGTLSAGAAVTESATGSATITGTQTAGGLVSVSANGIAFSGAVTSQTDAVTFNAGTGALTQAGTVSAGTSFTGISGQGTTLSGRTSAGFAVNLTSGTDLSLTSVSTTTAGTTLQVMAGGNATLAGTEQAGGTVSVTASGIGVSGSLVSRNGQVGLKATNGALTQAGTLTAAGALTESATGSATLSGTQTVAGAVSVAANGIVIAGTTGSTGAGVTLAAGAGALTQTGSVSGTSITETAAGFNLGAGSSTVATLSVSVASTGDVALAGVETASAGAITVKANGALSQSGTMNAGTMITGSAGGTLSLTGTMSAGTSIIESAGAGATLAGTTISAPLLTVTAPSITLSSPKLNVGGTVQAKGVKATDLPVAKTATSGAFFEAGAIFAASNSVVTPYNRGGVSTVRIDLTSGGGTILLNGLNSPSTNLILDLRAGSGTGNNLNVGNLTVLYTGQGFGSGSLNLNNVEVGGQLGIAAAGAAVVFPAPSREYRINACAVASVNCIVLRPQAVPIGNPLKELSLSFFRDQDDDRDLLVPNISDQGL